MVTKSWMEILSPTSAYSPNSTWVLGEKRSGSWTQQENKIFENALAHIDSRTPDRWERVAAMLPGKTVRDVVSHYHDLEEDVNHIEAGLIPCPGYSSSSLSFEWEGTGGYDGKSYCVGGKRGRFSDQERKKGVPWTEEEHKLFLLGLNKHGKGDWRNISRNFVVTRTPTQVASHAQKYFNRLNSGGKDKRRASIHDITIANLADNNGSSSPSQPSAHTSMQATTAVTPRGRSDPFSGVVDSEQRKEAARVLSPSLYGNRFVQVPNGTNPFGVKMASQTSYRGALHESMMGHHIMLI